MNYEDRLLLKARISAIQREKEERARRMHVVTASGEKLYLGGDSRPREEQIRSGYPHWSDQSTGKRGKVQQTRYTCGCDWNDPHIQRYGATMMPDGTITNKRYDKQGHEVCPIHGNRLYGWATTDKNDPPVGYKKVAVQGELGSPDIADRRVHDDPATVGEEWLARHERNGNPPASSLSKPAPMSANDDPVSGVDEP